MADMKYPWTAAIPGAWVFLWGSARSPKKTCNYSCIHCQLGRTDHFTNTRSLFSPVEEIMARFEPVLAGAVDFDVVTIAGEGEPTLYHGLGETDQPHPG